MNTPKKIYYFASTHWDREWYKTVDEFRFRLVPVIQKITRTLETDEDFKIFTTDGQTCILEDYLAVKKEDEQKLRTLIESGRLIVGPWFTMPDEFLLSHESLVQNLLKGHFLAKAYGAPSPMKNGYVCDIFGHIANLPQILNGFGIKSAFISRGTNDCDQPCFFRWRSPNGSETLTFKAPETLRNGRVFKIRIRYGISRNIGAATPRAYAHTERYGAYAVRKNGRPQLHGGGTAAFDSACENLFRRTVAKSRQSRSIIRTHVILTSDDRCPRSVKVKVLRLFRRSLCHLVYDHLYIIEEHLPAIARSL